jgi:hypothetical protein
LGDSKAMDFYNWLLKIGNGEGLSNVSSEIDLKYG